MRRHLSRAWWFSVVLLLLLALLLTSVRLGLQSIDRWRPEIESLLSDTLGVPVAIEQLHGQWNYALPVVQVQGLQVRAGGGAGPQGWLRLEQLILELDPFASLYHLSPVFQRFEARGAALRWHQRGGAWLHRPGAAPGADPDSHGGVAEPVWERLVGILQQQPYAVIRDVELTLVPEEGQSLVISPADLELENALREHRLSGLFRIPLLGETAEMRFVVETDSLQTASALDARYRLYLELEQLGPELFQLFGQEWGVEQLGLDMRIWAEFDRRQLRNAQAEVSLQRLALQQADVPYPRSARFNASLQPRGQDYQLQVRQLQLGHEQGTFELPLLMLQGPLSRQPERVQAGIEALDLSALSAWLVQAPGMPMQASELLRNLQPGGRLYRLRLDKPAGVDWRQLQLSADLEQLEVQGWHGAPALSGVNGRLEAGFDRGHIDLVSEDFGLHFPQLFPDRWRYSDARGRVRWQLDERGVRVASERLQLRDRHVQASGRFSIDLPFERSCQSELVLMIGMTDSDGSQASIYTPAREVGEGLHRWLQQALQGGRLRQGGLLLRTGTRNNGQPRTPVVQLFFDVAEGELAYQPGWPILTEADLFVLVRDAGLAININAARMLQSRIPSGWAYLAPGERRLQVETWLQGPVTDLDHLLKQTPLSERLGENIHDWQLDQGQAETRLGLSIPLQTDAAPHADVRVNLNGVRLRGAGRVEVTDLTGELLYRQDKGLIADRLQGRFLEHPVQARIHTQDRRYRVELSGSTRIEALQAWLQQPAFSVAKGMLHWQGVLDICADASCPQLRLTSELKGVALDLPGILAKSSEQSAPLELELKLAGERAGLSHLRARLPADGIAPLQVSGRMRDTGAVELQIQHPDITGRVQLATPEQPLRLNLAHLQLDALWSASEPVSERVSDAMSKRAPADSVASATGAIPAQLPVIVIDIEDLWHGARPVGAWSGRLQPVADGVAIQSLQGRLAELSIEGEAHWQQGSDEHTALALAMTGGDFGTLLTRWGLERVLETASLDSRLQLRWSGAPWAFSLESLTGELKFDTGEARLIEASDGTNILRVFGILNFNSLARRLRLDFTDLVKKGVSFDRISGHYRIEKGVASTLAPLQMEGPSANMTLQGRVDLAAGQLDNTVQVTLPVSSNAPLAAVLLGAPQVAGAVFVIDKLIGDKLERFSTLSYTLSGDWDDPSLELQTGSR
ncbi:YhdP family phospholipid transporter [Marinobacterium weihaiense]|uniref:YhdP central domain-containing protein n=1 Tax=Marinobacterium weihaiense TaxID=2851016 RepID=A0ABS6M9V4_9GAMM|nr:AsmA-like C-terminal region-containing protein [Marinobacterium weihaiense]MBV0933061.1 hypothetical protein [Marinobacterium weihaiense]